MLFTGRDGCPTIAWGEMVMRVIGTMSVYGSYGNFANVAGLCTNCVELIISVCPSGALFATWSLPTTVAAPGRGSTITCCFQRSERRGPMMRALASLLPPTGNGMTRRTILPGNGCARTVWDGTTSTAAMTVVQNVERMKLLLRLIDSRIVR